MKNIRYLNDDKRGVQVIEVKMTIREKIKFLFTGRIEIPYHKLAPVRMLGLGG